VRSPAHDSGMSRRARILLQIVIAAGLGAGYGLWGLEAASPLAIPLVLWAVMVLLLVWRLPQQWVSSLRVQVRTRAVGPGD
jgi:hypothetical protein